VGAIGDQPFIGSVGCGGGDGLRACDRARGVTDAGRPASSGAPGLARTSLLAREARCDSAAATAAAAPSLPAASAANGRSCHTTARAPRPGPSLSGPA